MDPIGTTDANRAAAPAAGDASYTRATPLLRLRPTSTKPRPPGLGSTPARRPGGRLLRLSAAAGALALASLGLAACGSGSGASAAHNPHLPASEVTAESVGSLGTVLVNGQGRTLYVYQPDHGSGATHCFGTCAAAWPPLVLPAGDTTPKAGPGVDPHLLATAARGGAHQVTYHGWPLYRWAADAGPGDATGQGLFNAGGYWYVIRPSGRLVT